MNWTFTANNNDYIESYYELVNGNYKATIKWYDISTGYLLDLYENINNQWILIDNRNHENIATLRGIAEDIIIKIIAGLY